MSFLYYRHNMPIMSSLVSIFYFSCFIIINILKHLQLHYNLLKTQQQFDQLNYVCQCIF